MAGRNLHAVGVEERPAVHAPHQDAPVFEDADVLVAVFLFQCAVFPAVGSEQERVGAALHEDARDAITGGHPYPPPVIFRDGMDEIVAQPVFRVIVARRVRPGQEEAQPVRRAGPHPSPAVGIYVVVAPSVDAPAVSFPRPGFFHQGESHRKGFHRGGGKESETPGMGIKQPLVAGA